MSRYSVAEDTEVDSGVDVVVVGENSNKSVDFINGLLRGGVHVVLFKLVTIPTLEDRSASITTILSAECAPDVSRT